MRARKEYCEIVVVYNTMTSTEKVSLNLDVYMEEKTINIHATVHGILFSFFLHMSLMYLIMSYGVVLHVLVFLYTENIHMLNLFFLVISTRTFAA